MAWVISDIGESWLGMELINPSERVVAGINRVILKSKPERTTQLSSKSVVQRIDRWARLLMATFTAKMTPVS